MPDRQRSTCICDFGLRVKSNGACVITGHEAYARQRRPMRSQIFTMLLRWRAVLAMVRVPVSPL